jgi:phosphoenolpyruvate carboxykinase (ATP)
VKQKQQKHLSEMCRCGNVKLKAVGRPILTASCSSCMRISSRTREGKSCTSRTSTLAPILNTKSKRGCLLNWHGILLIRPDRSELASFVPEFTIVDLPSFKADPKRHGVRSETVIAIDFTRKIILIGNSSYAGEIKKSVFTALNFYLPPQRVMPMHCSANVGSDGDVALFFGLSGTGKTTLSAHPNRILIGDDEHGWGTDGVFNFEGGCYAKCIQLSAEAEPEIYAATHRFGTVIENVVFDPETKICNFDDASEDREHAFRVSS